ncbi:glycosyltransferase family 4 protein [Paenibacillus filicis]|uniref:Glycosyltransferase family 4 protein n=1 Tax=Paenibacillus filicis TaxID=669464 RepID=A0ABU9DCJ1_9BACL
MNRKKTFYLMAPHFGDPFLTKDVGIIPYLMQKYYGYKSVYLTYRPSDGIASWPSMQLYTEKVEVEYIEPSFDYHPDHALQTVFGANIHDCARDLEQYISIHATRIDVLFIFGFYSFYFDPVAKYKELNPAGKVYLKLDANAYWINITPVNEPLRRFLSQCDLITSETLTEYISQRWSVPIHYLPNGYYPFGEDENYMNKIERFEEKEDIILTAARLGDHQKATHVLLEAFQEAAPYIPDSWKLVLAGSITDSFMPYVLKYTLEHPQLNERVVYTGYIHDKKELNKLFSKAKIFALPSITEGYPNVLSEAKKHGCYLVASDIESCRDAATKHELRLFSLSEQDKKDNRRVEYGSLHTVGDSHELAYRLIEACNNQSRLATVCYETQRDAADHFDWTKLCRKIDEWLQESI